MVGGKVQKVGYRDLVERETFGIDIKGYVENIADDKVRIVAEDPEEFREIREELVSIKDAPVKPA
nr:acylphosphatase [Methanoplanus limicola]